MCICSGPGQTFIEKAKFYICGINKSTSSEIEEKTTKKEKQTLPIFQSIIFGANEGNLLFIIYLI
jgi:hypothetical protein